MAKSTTTMTPLERLVHNWQGRIVSGHVWGSNDSGKPRDLGVDSLRLRIGTDRRVGGQAVVVKATVEDAERPRSVAVRVEFATNTPSDAFRRSKMLQLAHLSRTRPNRYPALLHVEQSFRCVVAGSEIGEAFDFESFQVWCDVMPWCPLSVSDLLRDNPSGMDPRRALNKLTPIIKTIENLWVDHRLVHRDIDEFNVLMDSFGDYRIVDWGIVTEVHADGQFTTTEKVGKYGGNNERVPPELRGAGLEVAGFTDLWLAGRLLFALCTGGCDPYAGDTGWSPLLEDLPGDIRGVIERLCDRDPTRRKFSVSAAGPPMEVLSLDANFLSQVGLGKISHAAEVLALLYTELEMRVGEALTEGMADEMLDEFGAFVDADMPAVERWLTEHFPGFDKSQEYRDLCAAQEGAPVEEVVAEYGAMMWLRHNRPDYEQVVVEAMAGLKAEFAEFLKGVQHLSEREVLKRIELKFGSTAP